MKHREFIYWLNGFLSATEKLDQNSIEFLSLKIEEVKDKEGAIGDFEAEILGMLDSAKCKKDPAVIDVELIKQKLAKKMERRKKSISGGSGFNDTVYRC